MHFRKRIKNTLCLYIGSLWSHDPLKMSASMVVQRSTGSFAQFLLRPFPVSRLSYKRLCATRMKHLTSRGLSYLSCRACRAVTGRPNFVWNHRQHSTLSEKNTSVLEQTSLLKYFQAVAKELKQIEDELLKMSGESQRTRELTEKVTRLSSIVGLFKHINELKAEISGLKDLEKGNDSSVYISIFLRYSV